MGALHTLDIHDTIIFMWHTCLWSVSVVSGEPNGHAGSMRLAHSLPGSPADRRPNSFEVIGSAESLVGRVSIR